MVLFFLSFRNVKVDFWLEIFFLNVNIYHLTPVSATITASHILVCNIFTVIFIRVLKNLLIFLNYWLFRMTCFPHLWIFLYFVSSVIFLWLEETFFTLAVCKHLFIFVFWPASGPLWRMFYVYLRKMCFLLVFSGVFFICLLDSVTW